MIVANSKANEDYLRITYIWEEPFELWLEGCFVLAGICLVITLIGICVSCVVECAIDPLINPMKVTVMRSANDVMYTAREADRLHVQELVKRKTAEKEIRDAYEESMLRREQPKEKDW